MNTSIWERYLPWGVIGLAGMYIVAYAFAPGETYRGFKLQEFGALPAVYRGRPQPLDSVARNSLMMTSGRQTFEIEKKNRDESVSYSRHSAIHWLADVFVAGPGLQDEDGTPAGSTKVFRIENEQVLDLFGLKARSGFRYSLAEMSPKMHVFLARYEEVRGIDSKKRNLYDNKVFELGERLHIFQMLASHGEIRCIPPPPGLPGDEWLTLIQAQKLVRAGVDVPGFTEYLTMLKAYNEDDSRGFNAAVSDYRKMVEKKFPAEAGVTRFEVFFNRFDPFYHAAVLYVFVFILACLSWVVWPRSLEQAAFALGMLTLLVHTWALIARMSIQGRPPVTNLYSSAVFIGWGCVALGLVLEYIFRNGMGCIVGSVTGALTLLIADKLASNGDTLEMMQAVLDTNFWLATHVTCITLGYTATFMAGFIGILYVLMGLFAPNRPREDMQNLTRMIYGVVCFALLLSFTGTVLGGIWADQSWGRFWGWDPKENGALLIVLMNALLLHARWGGMVKGRGMAVLAILGNVVTAWSWFGVNMLGVGLHSYGFMAGAVGWLITFVISQLLLAGLGMMDPIAVRKFFVKILVPEPMPIKATVPIKELSSGAFVSKGS